LESKSLTFDAVIGALHVETTVLQVTAHQVAHVLVIFD
jgi:hypothetical protein